MTRSIVRTEQVTSTTVESVDWRLLPAAGRDAHRQAIQQGLERGLASLERDRRADYIRYWAANFTYLFEVTHIAPPAPGQAAATTTVQPRQLAVLALRLAGPAPTGATALQPDATLYAVFGGDDLSEVASTLPLTMRFGGWPELTGQAGNLALWDPIRIQFETAGKITKPKTATGMLIDRGTWVELGGEATAATPSAVLLSRSFPLSANPLRWLATPGTILIDCLDWSDDGEARRRAWATNNWDLLGK